MSKSTLDEERIGLAIKAFESRQFRSVRATAAAYDVPTRTIQYQIDGRPTRQEAQAKNIKLSPTEESALLKWVLDMDNRVFSPRIAYTQQMANLLLAKRGGWDSPH